MKNKSEVFARDLLLRYSKSVSMAAKFFEWYGSFENRMEELYERSYLYGKMMKIRSAFKRYATGSFLIKIKNKNYDSRIIDGSKILRAVIGFLKTSREKFIRYFGSSGTRLFFYRVKTRFSKNALYMVSILVVSAIIANSSVLILVGIGVSKIGWAMRLIFILLALVVMLTDLSWENVKTKNITYRIFLIGRKN